MVCSSWLRLCVQIEEPIIDLDFEAGN